MFLILSLVSILSNPTECKRLERQLREIISFSKKKEEAVSWIVHKKQISVPYWSYCFINPFVILRPIYTPNGMTILEDIPLVFHSLLKNPKTSFRDNFSWLSYKMQPVSCSAPWKVQERFSGNNLVCCKGNWSCLHSLSGPFSYHFENHLVLPAGDAFFLDKISNINHYFLTRKELNTREELNAWPKIWKFSILAADL